MSAGKAWRKAMRGQLRQLHGDLCVWCRQEMIFDYTHTQHPRFATIEHLLPLENPERNATEHLRLACKSCNVRAGKPPHAGVSL